MIDKLLSLIAPHHCCGCDKIGSLLCDNCKNNITYELEVFCIKCGRPTAKMWLCGDCRVPYGRAWLVGKRDGILQRLIGVYKFERTMSAYRDLGDLILGVLPELPPNTVIVNIPTVSGHIRERGYDHMLLIGNYIAKKRNLKCQQMLTRVTDSKQRQSSAKERRNQAKSAFAIKGFIDPEKIYLLIDDVVTTGATIHFAAKLLKKAGAKQVWVAAVARQTLD